MDVAPRSRLARTRRLDARQYARAVPWFPLVAERDHDIQNPTNAGKIRELGELLRLRTETRVLDIACGRGGPAIILASTFGCRITGVEKTPEFASVARERAADAGLGDRIEVVEADASEYPLDGGSWDVAMCLGATFVWDGLRGTLDALVPAVRAGGGVAVGEPYWYDEPPAERDEGFTTLAETVRRFEAARLVATGLVCALRDDWDAYESQHWRAAEEWLIENPDHPEADELRREHERHKWNYLEFQRDRLGWAILVGRKTLAV
jgi:SAM-dependent methyltransferase